MSRAYFLYPTNFADTKSHLNLAFSTHLKHTWSFTTQLYQEWTNDNCFRLAAALSYYAIFSLAPIIVIVIATAGAFFGREAVTGEVYAQIQGLIGPEGAASIEGIVQNAYLAKAGFVATVVSVITLVLSATATFSTLQDSLNTIWKIKVRPERGLIKFLLTRAVSFAMLLTIGFLLIVSLVINAVLVALQDYIARILSTFSVYLIQGIQQFVSLGIIVVLFATLFRFLPDVHLRWADVWRGSLLTGLLFTIGKFAIGLYLGHSNLASTYGAAASVVIVMVWVNYSSWIFFIGAEYIYVQMCREGKAILPSRYAVRVKVQEIEEN